MVSFNAAFSLIAEGIAFYDAVILFKKQAVLYMPHGLTGFGKTLVANGLIHNKHLSCHPESERCAAG